MQKIRNRRLKPTNFVNNNSITEERNIDFAKLKAGARLLDDVSININALKRTNRNYADKDRILTALERKDVVYLRQASEFFYEVSGIYRRLCNYLAFLNRYDSMVTPYVNDDKMKPEKIMKGFTEVLYFVDGLDIKKTFNDIGLKILRNGTYYGYMIYDGDKPIIQELPVAYCRSRFFVNGRPVVDFDVKFFDDQFSNQQLRIKILNAFPMEIRKAYMQFKQGRLPQEPGETGRSGWVTLDPDLAFKLNLNDSDTPYLASVMPAILDLNEAQEVDKKKMLQELLKLVIQKMPIDKNGDLIFDVDEARDMHNNTVQMLSKAVGIDIVTTFADIEVANLSDKNSMSSKDDLQKIERGVFNDAGVSRNLFAADGNLALDKSIVNDETVMNGLKLQIESLLNSIISSKFNTSPKKMVFKVMILPTTAYNFEKYAKLYKDNAMLGYSKILPQLALGQSQSSIMATAYFENQVLNLSELMQPLQMSSTQGKNEGSGNGKKEGGKGLDKTAPKKPEGEKGRPEKDDSEKSTKTIQNKESAN